MKRAAPEPEDSKNASVKLSSLAWDGSKLEGELDAQEIFSQIEPTQEGLNIRGGIATLTLPGKKPERVVFKKMDADSVLNSVRVDRLKPLFGIPQTGSHWAQVRFKTPLTIERSWGKGDIVITAKAKSHKLWVLFQRYIDAPSLRKLTPEGGLRKIADAGFLRAFLFRMVTGTTDPNPSNFLVKKSTSGDSYYSVDEGSAFSAKMEPRRLAYTDEPKPWLSANLAKYALAPLDHMRQDAEKIYVEWKTLQSDTETKQRISQLLYTGTESASDLKYLCEYIGYNVQTLYEDFCALVSCKNKNKK